MNDSLREEVREALFEVQRYLLDQIPPLTASDSVEVLIAQPPELLMTQINAWAHEQSRLQSASMCDFLFYALKKVHLFGSLKLVERKAMDDYFDRLSALALAVCPVSERELLKTHLKAMHDSGSMGVTTAVEIHHVKKQEPAAENRATDGIMARSARRLGFVIERLASFLPKINPAPPAAAATPASAEVVATQHEPAAHLVSMAAQSSSSEQELESYLDTLKAYTGNAQAGNIFQVLAAGVPAWEVNVPQEVKVKPAAPVEAMHKIMTLTKSPADSTRRFRELLNSAVEQFNAGSLGAAVSIFELADIVIVEKKLDPSTVERIRSDVVESINSDRLKKYAENKSKHAALRKALTFFPTLTRDSLLVQLRGEEKPERRRSLLGLLEAYGREARNSALHQLEEELGKPVQENDSYYERNLIYLLHRIPRDLETPPDKEIELLARATARGKSIYVMKEATTAVGQIKSEAAVKLLTTRLAEVETALLRNDTTYPVDEMQKLLDRIVAALARIATPAALLTIARHGMKPNPLLGDTRSRLAGLAQHDLSFDEQTVNILLKAVRDDLPTKLLGKILPKRTSPVKIIEALGGTRSDTVDHLLHELKEKFADHDVGRAAASILSARATAAARIPASPDAGPASLTGDLQFFSLPSLLQSLADAQATGIVTLISKQTGQTAGKLLFMNGNFLDAQAGHLRGAISVYQLFERPVVGTFAFVPQQNPPASAAKAQPLNIMSLILEGIRRHDELNQASVLVPDDIVLKPTGVKPTPPPEEDDPAIMRDIWTKAMSGGRVGEWEKQLPVDAYRVRKLVAHWLEEGSLQPVS